MKVSLAYNRTVPFHPQGRAPIIEVIFRVMCNGQQLESKGGRYEGAYTDSYTPHPHEFAILEELRRLADEKFRVRSMPDPLQEGMVFFEVIKTWPASRDFGDIDVPDMRKMSKPALPVLAVTDRSLLLPEEDE